ncbi:MAG: hypothetical protein ACR2KT_05160 [Methylocella sp.]
MAYGKNNTKKAQQRETTPPALIAWHVAERGEKKFWNRIGAAWEHEDGDGLTLQLDLIPVAGAASFSGSRRKTTGLKGPNGKEPGLRRLLFFRS